MPASERTMVVTVCGVNERAVLSVSKCALYVYNSSLQTVWQVIRDDISRDSSHSAVKRNRVSLEDRPSGLGFRVRIRV